MGSGVWFRLIRPRPAPLVCRWFAASDDRAVAGADERAPDARQFWGQTVGRPSGSAVPFGTGSSGYPLPSTWASSATQRLRRPSQAVPRTSPNVEKLGLNWEKTLL